MVAFALVYNSAIRLNVLQKVQIYPQGFEVRRFEPLDTIFFVAGGAITLESVRDGSSEDTSSKYTVP